MEILEYNFSKVDKRPDPTTLCLIAAEAGLSEEETQVSRAGRCRPVGSLSRLGVPPGKIQSPLEGTLGVGYSFSLRLGGRGN